jgi:hypothetical protein
MFVGIALVIVYVVWGSTRLAIRIMVEQMPPSVSAGTRLLTAGILVATAFAAYQAGAVRLGRRVHRALTLGIGLGNDRSRGGSWTPAGRPLGAARTPSRGHD